MSILSNLSPEARTGYIEIGRAFSSTDTLAQADKTLAGCAKYGMELKLHGFAAKDAAKLKEARDTLLGAGVGRADARSAKKASSETYRAAVAHGREARLSARAILEGTRVALGEQGTIAGTGAVRRLDAALAATRRGSEEEQLAEQLDVLRGTLSDPVVAAEAADRGGPEAVVQLQSSADELRSSAAARAGAAGTPAETETLDALDGIVVTLSRSAFKAARAAARRLATPALAAAFELDLLYPTRGAKAAAGASPSAPPPPAPVNGAPPNG